MLFLGQTLPGKPLLLSGGLSAECFCPELSIVFFLKTGTQYCCLQMTGLLLVNSNPGKVFQFSGLAILPVLHCKRKIGRIS
jgi:hypothetical protein